MRLSGALKGYVLISSITAQGIMCASQPLPTITTQVNSAAQQMFPVLSTMVKTGWMMTPRTLTMAKTLYDRTIPEGLGAKFGQLYHTLQAGIFVGSTVSIIVGRRYFMTIIKWMIVLKALFAARTVLRTLTGHSDQKKLESRIAELEKQKRELEAEKSSLLDQLGQLQAPRSSQQVHSITLFSLISSWLS